VLMADVEVDQLAGKVEVLFTGRVPEVRAFAARYFNRVKSSLCRPRVENVGSVVEVGLCLGCFNCHLASII
jgi:hypothetical protein